LFPSSNNIREKELRTMRGMGGNAYVRNDKKINIIFEGSDQLIDLVRGR
jgi:hypothetical protein